MRRDFLNIYFLFKVTNDTITIEKENVVPKSVNVISKHSIEHIETHQKRSSASCYAFDNIQIFENNSLLIARNARKDGSSFSKELKIELAFREQELAAYYAKRDSKCLDLMSDLLKD